MSSEIHWIKITTDMFDDEKIRLIEKMPDGDTLLVIFIKLLTLTGRVNAGGYILLTESIPYTEEMLATIFDRPLMTVQLALKTFERYGMLHLENGTMVITNWEKHQNIEALEKIREQARLRVARHRLKDGNVTPPLQVTEGNGTEVELELEVEVDNKNKKKDKIIYGQFSNVLLTTDEAEALIKKFGIEGMDAKVQNLSEYIASKGITRYKSHYATILNFARRDGNPGNTDSTQNPGKRRPNESDPDKYIKGKYGHMILRGKEEV